ncbi:MAG: DUF72 domain-containing protein [Candidatus Binatia bacterium]
MMDKILQTRPRLGISASHDARNFDTVEINPTFYHLPSPLTFDRQALHRTYSRQELAAEAKWIKQLAGGNDVFAYFNNDAQGYAVKNAPDLKRHIAR